MAPPVQIYHPVFNRFTQIVGDRAIQPTNEDLKQAQKLMKSLSYINTKVHPRNAMIREKLCDILEVDIYEEPNDDETSNNGDYLVTNFRIPLLVIQLKEELGECASDPSSQVGLTMKRAWIHRDVSHTFALLLLIYFLFSFCLAKGNAREVLLPLVGGGPWLGVLGGVFTDKVIVQRLTDLMWLAHSTTEEDPPVYRLARVLVALRRSIHELQKLYKNISDYKEPVTHAWSHIFPLLSLSNLIYRKRQNCPLQIYKNT